MKKIREKREVMLAELDVEYAMLRESLELGNAPAQFNKKGQRTQNTTLAAFKVQVEEIQELNRIQRLLKK